MSKKQKSIEELVEKSLVPAEDQPYEIPENWIWSNAGALSKTLRGVSYKKHHVESLKDLNNSLILRGGNIQDGHVVNQKDNVYISKELVKEEQKLQKGDVVIVSSTGSSKVIGKAASISLEFVGESFGAFLTTIRPSKKIDDGYFSIFYQTSNYRNLISKLAKGSNINNIKKEHLDNLPFPIPPLNEQKRIAEKIERLLNKVEEAKRLIEEAKETFELRRAAILDKAFRGELTRKWREENQNMEENKSIQVSILSDSKMPYVIPDTWRWDTLKDIAEFKNGYAFKSKDFVDQGIQLIRMGNLYKNDLALERNPVYLPKEYDAKIFEKYTIKNGDILLSLTGTKYKRDYGYAVKVDGIDKPLLLNQRILSLKPKRMDEYVFYYLQSSAFRNTFFGFETGGVNQGNVGSKAVESIVIPVPPLDEAKEIEKKLVAILEKETESLKILHVEEQLETLKQTILSKAFRGELGTNDPSEENAIELLKEVLQEQVK